MENKNQVATTPKATQLRTMLEKSKDQIAMALPKHLTPDRLLRIAMTEAQKNPKLLECSQVSFIGAIIQTAQLGLEPGGHRGHSYLVPFKNNKTNQLEVQFIVGYKGMVELAYRSPKVKKVVGRAVFKGDDFSYEYGLNEKLEHRPKGNTDPKDLTHTYVFVELEGGAKLFHVCTIEMIEDARSRSKAKDSGPWNTDYVDMAVKTAVRQFAKFIPSAVELQAAADLDYAADRGEQNNSYVMEAVGVKVEEKADATQRFKDDVGSEQKEPQKDEDVQSQGEFGSFESRSR